MALTAQQIDDSDTMVSLIKSRGPLTAMDIYNLIGKNAARVIGFAVQSGRIVRDGDSFKLPPSYIIETAQPSYDWSNQ